MLDQLLDQLKIEPEGAAPQAEIEPLVAMGEQVLAEGDAPRAVNIFRQVREMAPDNPEVIGGLVRALVAGGDEQTRRDDILGGLPEELSKNPEISRARAALEVASAPTVDTSAPRGSPRRQSGRSRGAVRVGQRARWPTATAMPPPTPCSKSSAATASGTRAPRAQRFLQLLEAQGLEDPWSSAQRRRLSALLFT